MTDAPPGFSSMKYQAHQACQDRGCHNNKKWLPLQSLPLVLWQQDPSFTDWLWLLLASSPIVVLIILLTVAILILLLVVWLRARRQPPHDTTQTLPPSAETAIRDAAQPSATTVTSDEAATIPSPATYSEDLAKTQPSSVVKPAQEEPTVFIEQELRTVPVSGQRPANIGWQIAGLTDVGLKRELNEDTLLMAESVIADNTPIGLYVVADGLGGHQGGEIASQLTIEAIHTRFSQNPPNPAAAPVGDWLKEAAMAANQAVLARQEDQTQGKKMGSTVVMALVVAEEAHIANVGDSRAYHLNSEQIKQISVDHSLVERLVQIGQLTREEARTHKNRNVLYNTLGDKTEIEIGLFHTQLQSGDRLLLCSDGLSGMISDEEILEISRNQSDPAQACREMIAAAKTAGGSDNITAIIVQQNT
jgi:serine/threonine protein phosphatase PrpC